MLLEQVFIVTMLYPYSMMNSADKPNLMRWRCALVAGVQWPLLLLGLLLAHLVFYSRGGSSFTWIVTVSAYGLLPIALFLMVLKRDYVSKETATVSLQQTTVAERPEA